VLSYLIYYIIKRSSTKVVQIMPLGFSIIESTVTFSSGERPRALWALLFCYYAIETKKKIMLSNRLHF